MANKKKKSNVSLTYKILVWIMLIAMVGSMIAGLIVYFI